MVIFSCCMLLTAPGKRTQMTNGITNGSVCIEAPSIRQFDLIMKVALSGRQYANVYCQVPVKCDGFILVVALFEFELAFCEAKLIGLMMMCCKNTD